MTFDFGFFDLIFTFGSTLGASKNWDRWSDIVAVVLPEIALWEIILRKILSIRGSEWLVILVGCKIYGMKEIEAIVSNNSLVGWLS